MKKENKQAELKREFEARKSHRRSVNDVKCFYKESSSSEGERKQKKNVSVLLVLFWLDMADGLKPSHIMIWFLEISGLQPSAFALFL